MFNNYFNKNILSHFNNEIYTLSLHQIIYCILKESYDLKEKDNFMSESWEYICDNNDIISFEINEIQMSFYKNNEYHNDSRDENGHLLPAVIENNGIKRWYINGMPHNDSRDEN